MFSSTQVPLVQDRKETATILFLAYRNYLKSVALRYLPFPHLADEALQQVYVEFLSDVDRWDFDGNVKALLAVMTQNISRALWKSESRHQSEHLQSIAKHVLRLNEPESDIDTERYSEDLQHLHECLKKTSKKSQTLIQLHYFESQPLKEVADQLELKIESLYRAFHRIKGRLRVCMGQRRAES